MDKIFVGIDVSKARLDIALPKEGSFDDRQYGNDPVGIGKFLKEMPSNAVLVMEASGPYHLRLAYAGYAKGFEVFVLNPLSVKRYCQMRLMRTKTDKADARAISGYAQVNPHKAWSPPAKAISHLQHIDALIALLTKLRTQVIGHQSANEVRPMPNKVVVATIRSTIKTLEKSIAKLEKEIDGIVKIHFEAEIKRLRMIPGIGKKTAVQILIVTQNFQKFASGKSLVAFAGLCPRIYQSGTNQRTSFKICKLGQGRLRSLLYMCSMTAKNCNPSCKLLFDRLVEKGKNKKLALVAVAAKLLRQAFAIGTSKEDFNGSIS